MKKRQYENDNHRNRNLFQKYELAKNHDLMEKFPEFKFTLQAITQMT